MYFLPVEKLNEMLLTFLGSKERVNEWWKAPNKVFDMKKPRDVYIDQPDRVTRYVLECVNR